MQNNEIVEQLKALISCTNASIGKFGKNEIAMGVKQTFKISKQHKNANEWAKVENKVCRHENAVCSRYLPATIWL